MIGENRIFFLEIVKLLSLFSDSPLTLTSLMCRTGSGMAGSAVDDSRMPIDEATATERLDIEYLLTKCYAIVHQAIRVANEKVDLIPMLR